MFREEWGVTTYWRKILVGFGLLAVASMVSGKLVYAQAVKTQRAAVSDFKILGIRVEPFSGVYMVLKDVNVRAKPLTGSKRVGRLKAGRRVNAVGRVKGPWLAVRTDNNVLGFIFKPILMPIIDGALSQPLKGEIALGGGRVCNYVIEFLGKTEAKNLRFEFADFEVRWRCKTSGKAKTFYTPMFLSEGPHQGTQRPVHQITIDVLDMESGLEEVFSTHLLWDRDEGEVRFDSVSNKKFLSPEKLVARPVNNMAAALNGALHLAASSWTRDVWSTLVRTSNNR